MIALKEYPRDLHVAGALVTPSRYDIDSALAGETIAPGLAVAWSPDGAVLPDEDTVKLWGIAAFDPYAFEPPYAAGTPVNVVRTGRVRVTAEAAVNPTLGVFVRVMAGDGGTVRGSFRGDDDGGTCRPVGGAAWRTTARAGDFAELVLNFPGVIGPTGADGPPGPTGPTGPTP
jgi:hypothetical protein